MADAPGAKEPIAQVGREAGRAAEELRPATMKGYEDGRELAYRNVERQPLLALLMVAAVCYLFALRRPLRFAPTRQAS
jgi:hypothetical protein